MQHQNLDRITQITMIKLVVANAMESHRRLWSDHEIECRAGGPPIKKWCWEPAGRNSLVADKCDAYETACGVGLELQQHANAFGRQIIGHSNLNIERQTSNVQFRKDSRSSIGIGAWTSNLKFQKAKIEQA